VEAVTLVSRSDGSHSPKCRASSSPANAASRRTAAGAARISPGRRRTARYEPVAAAPIVARQNATASGAAAVALVTGADTETASTPMPTPDQASTRPAGTRPAGRTCTAGIPRLWHARPMADDVPAPAPDAPTGPVPRLTPVEAALIAETCSRGEVIWVRPPDEPRYHAAWHVWHEDGPVLVYGVGEQMLPLLSGEVEVVARGKETGARLVTFVAYARTLTPGSAEWEAATTELAAHRLNATDPAGARERWASGGLVIALRPLWLVRSGNG